MFFKCSFIFLGYSKATRGKMSWKNVRKWNGNISLCSLLAGVHEEGKQKCQNHAIKLHSYKFFRIPCYATLRIIVKVSSQPMTTSSVSIATKILPIDK